MSTEQTNPRDVIAQALALSEAATDGPWEEEYDIDSDEYGIWADNAGSDIILAERGEDAAFAAARTLLPVLAKALGDVLDLMDDYGRAAHRSTNGTQFDVLAVRRALLSAAITAALSEVTP